MKKHLGLLLVLGTLAISHSSYGISNTEFFIELNGANEVSNGDPDGYGSGTLKLDGSTNEIVWDFIANNILIPITGFHIHNAPAGSNGGVVYNFQNALNGSDTNPIVQAILADPTQYYLNLHTQEHPSGAIRGQVANPVPDSSTAAIGALAIGATLIAGRRIRRKQEV